MLYSIISYPHQTIAGANNFVFGDKMYMAFKTTAHPVVQTMAE
jgi:hypothetical protein